MPRRDISANDRSRYAQPVLWSIESAVYIHPGNVTTAGLMPGDATTRFLAVPPLTASVSQHGNAIRHASSDDLYSKPSHVELYRADEFWWRIDAAADTLRGAYRPGGIPAAYPLNPGAATLSFTSITNTSPLRVNWLWAQS